MTLSAPAGKFLRTKTDSKNVQSCEVKWRSIRWIPNAALWEINSLTFPGSPQRLTHIPVSYVIDLFRLPVPCREIGFICICAEKKYATSLWSCILGSSHQQPFICLYLAWDLGIRGSIQPTFPSLSWSVFSPAARQWGRDEAPGGPHPPLSLSLSVCLSSWHPRHRASI